MEPGELDHDPVNGSDWFRGAWIRHTPLPTKTVAIFVLSRRLKSIMDSLINFDLLKHPLNWFTVLLMVLIAGIAIHLIADSFGVNPARAIDTSQNPPGS
jgi:hypothetical protein